MPTDMTPRKIVQLLKMLRDEFPELKKTIGGNICGQEVTFVERGFSPKATFSRRVWALAERTHRLSVGGS